MSLASTLVAIPCALVLPLPEPASWPWLGASAAIQLVYVPFLVLAYRHGELGQIYPIIRGVVPLFVTLGAALFAGEHLGLGSLAGITLVSLGIMSLALGRGRAKPRAVAAALATGVIIATYTLIDGVGARLAGSPYRYAAWIFVLYGTFLPLGFFVFRRRPHVALASRETLKAAIGGSVQLLTYGTVIYAFTLSAIGPVAALRETSVVFAALIGRVFLGESATLRRIAACLAIVGGAICLSYRR
jgi:drug/metabolite transporter (DMT)-like permease